MIAPSIQGSLRASLACHVLRVIKNLYKSRVRIMGNTPGNQNIQDGFRSTFGSDIEDIVDVYNSFRGIAVRPIYEVASNRIYERSI